MGKIWRAEGGIGSYLPPPGSTLAAHLYLIVWCKACRHQVEPDVAEQVERYGADLPVPEWAGRLRCGECGSREVDFVVSGGRR